MKIINCDRCGTPMYKVGDNYYCPNCDDKPQISKSDEEHPKYIGLW